MPRRRPARRTGQVLQPGRRRILIYCGARRTEPDYFSGLVQGARPRSVLVHVKYKGIAPHQLVAVAAAFSRRQRDQYDEVWCVVDVDEYDVGSAVREASRAGVTLAVSNPCFEVWLLLHHEPFKAWLASCDEAAMRLRRWLRHYEKTRLRFGDFRAGIADAVERARELDPTGRTGSATRRPACGGWWRGSWSDSGEY